MSYIHTALTGSAPPDRSYFYGILIAAVTFFGHSLIPLLFLQVLASASTCIVLSAILKRYFELNFWEYGFIAVLCSIEPIQLFYERNVMTETFSLLFFVLFVYFLLHYVSTVKLSHLVLSIISGFLMIKLRMVFIPIYLLGLFLASIHVTATIIRTHKNSQIQANRLHRLLKIFSFWFVVFFTIPFLFSTAKTIQTRYGKLPNYSATGFALLSAWAPLLETNTIPFGPDLREIINNSKCEIGNIQARNSQRWLPGCLIKSLIKKFENRDEANQFSMRAAKYLLLHDPVGIIKIGAATYLDYLKNSSLNKAAVRHRGLNIPLNEKTLNKISEAYCLSLDPYPNKSSITGAYFQKAILWYQFLLVFPIILFLGVIIMRPQNFFIYFIFFLHLAQLMIIAMFSQLTSIRYLHPIAWISFLSLGILYNMVKGKINSSAIRR